MAAPVLSSFAKRLYDSMAPVAADDASHSYALALFCSGLGSMFQIVDDYGRDQIVSGKQAPGWSQVVDVNRVPDAAIIWLAQFVGADITAGLTPAQQRLQIKNVNGWQRGTRNAMISAAQATLTGTQAVTFIERNGDPYTLTVITKTSETPNPASTFAALLAQKPAGIILNYQNLTGQTYFDLFTTNAASYAVAFANYSNYQNLLLNNSAPPSTPTNFGTGHFGDGTFGGGT